jgi:hypothetical protein
MVYSYSAVKKLIELYGNDCAIYTIEGGLIDSYILTAPNKKTAIIKEVYLNEWASGATIRLYNKTPKKYDLVISYLENGEIDKAAALFYK